MWTWAAILTVIAVVAAVVFWLTQLVPANVFVNSAREIPNLQGVSQETAVETLKELNLVPVPVVEPNDEYPAEQVFKTYPAAGETVETGSTVRVHVSSGPLQAEVPDLQGKTVEEATEILADLGLTVGLTDTVDHATVPGGSVISSAPEAGSELISGSSVDLTVSSGKVAVPDVQGMTMNTARDMLSSTGVNIEETPDSSCPQQPDLPVINQSAVGPVEQRSTVTVFYCSGSNG